MFRLSIPPEKLPRTMTRAEWRETYRWLRISQHKINEAVADFLVKQSPTYVKIY